MKPKKNHDLSYLIFIRDIYVNSDSYTKKHQIYSKLILTIVFVSALLIGYLSKMYSFNTYVLNAIFILTGFFIGLSIYFNFSSKNIALFKEYELLNLDAIEKHINEKET